jgi:hypothetical protein
VVTGGEISLVEFGSDVVADTVAVLLHVPGAAAVTLIVADLLAYCPRLLPRSQLTVVIPLTVVVVQGPGLADAETNATPAGSVSVTVIPSALFGPALYTLIVYCRLAPTNTEPVGDTNLVVDRSAEVEVTVVVTGGVVWSPGTGSPVGLDTVAVFVIDGTAKAVGVTVILIVTLCPLVIVPRLHETVALPLQVPAEGGVTVVDTHVTFAGRVSVTPTLDAELGPLFVTTMVYVRLFPTTTEPAEADLVIERSAPGFTEVVVVELSLLGTGSPTPLDTIAVFVIDGTAKAVGFTVMAIVTFCPFVMVPRVQVTVALPLQVPAEGGVTVVEIHVTFAGSVSVTDTPVAALGPLFTTASVYVRFCPANTGLGEADFVIETSAEAVTVVVVVELLLLGTGSPTPLDTVAVFVIDGTAKAVGVTVILIVTFCPFVMVPRLHETVVVPLQVPAEGGVTVVDTHVTFVGSGSVIVTEGAAFGPPFATVMVYTRFCPTGTGSGAAVLMIERLAAALTGVDTGGVV